MHAPDPARSHAWKPTPLAVSAAQAFAEPLHVGRPNVPDRAKLLRRIEGALTGAGSPTTVRSCKNLKRRWCGSCQVKHVVAMCNGTTALEIAIRRTGTERRGDRPVVHVRRHGARVRSARDHAGIRRYRAGDASHRPGPGGTAHHAAPTTGIIGVHTWGRPCDVDALAEIADRRGLTLLFDAAHAMGCTHRGVPIGRFGTPEVFSFHATKCVHSFEGGEIATNDDALAEKLRLMHNFGFAGYNRVVYLGINGKLSEIHAAMGLTSLEDLRQKWSPTIAAISSFTAKGLPAFQACDYLTTTTLPPMANYQYVVVECDPAASPLGRDELAAVLTAENVRARRYFYPGCHRMEPYRLLLPDASKRLPVTEEIAAKVLLLPTGPTLGETEIHSVCGILHRAAAESVAVRALPPDGASPPGRIL